MALCVYLVVGPILLGALAKNSLWCMSAIDHSSSSQINSASRVCVHIASIVFGFVGCGAIIDRVAVDPYFDAVRISVFRGGGWLLVAFSDVNPSVNSCSIPVAV